MAAFEPAWGAYIPHMSGFVRIAVSAAEFILSPAYDLGITEDELRRTNLGEPVTGRVEAAAEVLRQLRPYYEEEPPA